MMHDLGQHIFEHDIGVAILHELYAVNDCIRVVPADMRVSFLGSRPKWAKLDLC